MGLALAVCGVSFGVANILVQSFNLAFYGLIFFCVFKMTPSRIAAMLLAVSAVTVLLSTWGSGEGNLNDVPSALGFRYLPILCMVTSISVLKAGERHSVLTACSAIFASLWSFEACICALGIHLAFVALTDLRERRWGMSLLNALLCATPVVFGLAALFLVTRSLTGQWPNYPIYLDLIALYSPLVPYWGIAANGMFWGWVPLAAVLVFVLTEAVYRILFVGEKIVNIDDQFLFQRLVPMACLLAVTSAYFAGRSVDYTIALAVLPFCALAIPAFLYAARMSRPFNSSAVVVTATLGALAVWSLALGLTSLFRRDSPYLLLAHECAYHGRCSAAALRQELRDGTVFRPWLQAARSSSSSAQDDLGIVEAGVKLINRWAGDKQSLVVLLGDSYDLGFSQAALMYTNKADRWPRSFTFLDQKSPKLSALILATPVELQEGDIAIIRRNTEAFGPLDTKIYAKVRAKMTLCELDGSTSLVAAYRTTSADYCADTPMK